MAGTIDLDLPDLTGRRAVLTGGSDGIGLRIAQRLALAGAEVVLLVRDLSKGEEAAAGVRRSTTGARVELQELELSSLASVSSAADALLQDGRPIHLLINNAGIMAPPERRVTTDGFELQLGVNHLGHFALTAALLPLLQAGSARVTSQISVSANQGAVRWADPSWERGYRPSRAYSSSKIAQGLFGLELDRRSRAAGWGITSNLAHPGVAPTSLLAARPELGRAKDTVGVRVIRALSRRGVLVGTPDSAALPALLAATGRHARGGALYGPAGPGHLSGGPAEQPVFSRLRSEQDAQRIWALSERWTGTPFPA